MDCRHWKKKSKPFAHSTNYRSAKFVATDDDEPEGSNTGGNVVTGGSSGTGGGNGVTSGGTGGNAVAGGSTGPGTSSWDHMQEKRAKDLKAAAKAKQRMEADIAADIVSGKMKPQVKRKRQLKSAKEIDEDDYDDKDGRVYVFGNNLLDEDLCILPLAPTTPALTVGNPVCVRLRGRPPPNPQPHSSRPHPRSQAQWYFIIANRHPKPKETVSIPALTSTSTADDRISSSPTQSRFTPISAAPARRQHPPPVHAATLTQTGAYVTIHCISPFIAARCPAVPRHPQPGTVDAVTFWRASGAGHGCIATHHAPSSIILFHALAASQHRVYCTRASSTAVLPISAAAGELSPPQVAAEKILRDGAERSNRWPQVPKQLSSGLDYTNRPTVFSRPSVHLIYTAQDTGAHLHPVLHPVLFATHLISSRRALPHLDYATMCFRGGAGSRRCACAAAGPAGSGSFWGSLPPYKCSPVRGICPSRILTARRSVRGGPFALQLGDVHVAAWVFGTPRTHAARRTYAYIYLAPSHRPHLDRTQLGFHNAVFMLLEQRSAYPPPISSLRGHSVPRRVADTDVRLRRLELELLELWCGSSTPKGSGGPGAGTSTTAGTSSWRVSSRTFAWKPATQAETPAVVPAAHVVRKLNQQGASDVTFLMREGRTMSVARCFQDTTGRPLKFPGLLCVNK
ncbi:hypothetical protein B0H14DRAFT_3518374 [Mycena olivaceomarginata]|nr:hypothetical protein B0H14DRAFT_3518374 [Mycena olivaceomarginata]